MTLAADALRRLAIHGSSGSGELLVADRLDDLARALLRATNGLDRCEMAMRERLEEPTLTILALSQRRDALRSNPAAQLTELRQLAAELAREREQHDISAIEESTIRAQWTGLAQQVADAMQRRSQLEIECTRLNHSLEEYAAEESKGTAALASLNDDLARVHRRVAAVRTQLEALRTDPREEIRDAVKHALKALPQDAFDATMRATT